MRLSSSVTIIYKILLPVSWVAFGIYAFLNFYRAPHPASESSKALPFILFWVFGMAIILLKGGNLKKIHYDGRQLRISNFWREEQIPLKQLMLVEEAGFMSGTPKKIILRQFDPACHREKRIVFVPRLFQSKEIAAMLRRQAEYFQSR